MKLYRTVIVLILFILFIFLSQGARSTTSSFQEFQAQEGTDWTVHRFKDGRVRAMYGTGSGRLITKESEARLFFVDYAEMFGIQDLSQVHLENVESDESGTSYFFRQHVFEIPVVGGRLAVHTDRNGRLLAAGGEYHSMTRLSVGFIRPREDARLTAARLRYSDAGLTEGRLMILPGIHRSRIAWKFSAISNRIPGQWAIYVDALLPHQILRVQREFTELDATGTIFLENSVVTPALTSEEFRHLSNKNNLSGKFTKIYNANFQLSFPRNGVLDGYTTATEPDQDYTFPTSDPRFTEAMGYYHINIVHDRWRSFGFKKLNRPLPVFVNIVTGTGQGYDNAFYTRGGFSSFRNGAIVMGSGNFFENFGHDADVFYHEYGHAVLDRAKPGFFETLESNYPWAFHEGFSDISAAAITGNAKLAEFALRSRKSQKFYGRNLENTNRYPQDVILKPFGKSESHHTGLIIGGAWWDLQKEIGIDTAQKILYKSLAILPDEMNFFDLRNSMLTADLRSNQGANEDAIWNAFAKHGVEGDDPGQKGTVQIQSLKTATYNFSNNRLSIKSKFHRGDYIVVLAGYSATGLTPGYNFVVSDFQIAGPLNSNVDAYPSIDEAVNGTHTGKKGAWIAEIATYENSAAGEYTISLRCRLGGTSTLSDTKTVKFQLTE